MTTHIMTDIETLGTKPGCIALSAAFVRFTDEASTSLTFSVPEQQALGLTWSQDTIDWWAQQPANAYQAAIENPVPLVPALQHFAAWLAWAAPDGDFQIWCHGATFDCPILGEIYDRAGVAVPWKFWNIRDTRTLYDLACINVKDFAVPPPHIALNDAIAQTRAANAALRVLARAHTGVAA